MGYPPTLSRTTLDNNRIAIDGDDDELRLMQRTTQTPARSEEKSHIESRK